MPGCNSIVIGKNLLPPLCLLYLCKKINTNFVIDESQVRVMMKQNRKITLNGNMRNSGLSFRVMQAAYENNVSGFFRYSENSASIEVEGDVGQLDHFFNALKTYTNNNMAKIMKETDILKGYKEFEIY